MYKDNLLKFTCLVTALVLLFVAASAQKQPQVQEVSVRAPTNIKIDGKLTEWPAYLNAYNATSRFYYVVANDDNNLYLIMRGLGTLAAQKALIGGITFTISHNTEKKARAKAPDNISITFPVAQSEEITDGIMGPLFNLGDFLKDTVANKKQIDSIVSVSNKRVTDAMKVIGVTGIKEIPDSVVSIYNITGIKAAMRFIKRQPVIEIAMPLKLLKLSAMDPVKFSYNIKLNGLPYQPTGGNPDLEKTVDNNTDQSHLYFSSPNDFWGDYTLVKQ